jgi:hypothetical protein
LKGRLLERACLGLGSHSGFLLRSLCNYVIDEFRSRNAAKNSPSQALLPLEQVSEEDEPKTLREPFDDGDLSWTRAAIAGALLDMRQACMESGRERLWNIFEGRVLKPILRGESPAAYGQFSGSEGFASPAQAANGLMTAKRIFKRHLKRVFGQYAEGEPECLSETHLLRRCLHGAETSQLHLWY